MDIIREFFFPPGIIEKNTWAGLAENYEILFRLFREECGEMARSGEGGAAAAATAGPAAAAGPPRGRTKKRAAPALATGQNGAPPMAQGGSGE